MTAFDPLLTGGCGFRAGRVRASATGGDPSVCHVRTCRQASGSDFGPFGAPAAGAFAPTRGAPRRWRSSDRAGRGFRADCGTPLVCRSAGDEPGVALGALDDLARLPSVVRIGVGSRQAVVDGLAGLPVRPAAPGSEIEAFTASIVPRQHRDRDTAPLPEGETR